MSGLKVLVIVVGLVQNVLAEENCAVGSKWVDNFIRFECFQQGTVRGFRAIGQFLK